MANFKLLISQDCVYKSESPQNHVHCAPCCYDYVSMQTSPKMSP